jgi:hypothetical protein
MLWAIFKNQPLYTEFAIFEAKLTVLIFAETVFSGVLRG